MKSFKFLQENKQTIFFHFVSGLGYDIDEIINNTPQDVIDVGEVGAYREGVIAGVNSRGINPYHDQLRGEIWNRGFWNATNIIHRP